jgi:mRNA-degrading endonuclease RelE of RelBE toxin-antitoxin system
MPLFELTSLALKKFQKLAPDIQLRIKNKTVSIKDHPDFFVLLESLKNFTPATHRLRIGNYRLILQYMGNDQFLVLDLGHRRDIYR